MLPFQCGFLPQTMGRTYRKVRWPPARRTYSQGTAMPDVDKRAACQSDILVGIMWRTQGSFRSRSRSRLSRDLGSYCPAEKAKLRKRESLYLVLRTDTDSPEARAFAIRRYENECRPSKFPLHNSKFEKYGMIQ